MAMFARSGEMDVTADGFPSFQPRLPQPTTSHDGQATVQIRLLSCNEKYVIAADLLKDSKRVSTELSKQKPRMRSIFAGAHAPLQLQLDVPGVTSQTWSVYTRYLHAGMILDPPSKTKHLLGLVAQLYNLQRWLDDERLLGSLLNVVEAHCDQSKFSDCEDAELLRSTESCLLNACHAVDDSTTRFVQLCAKASHLEQSYRLNLAMHFLPHAAQDEYRADKSRSERPSIVLSNAGLFAIERELKEKEVWQAESAREETDTEAKNSEDEKASRPWHGSKRGRTEQDDGGDIDVEELLADNPRKKQRRSWQAGIMPEQAVAIGGGRMGGENGHDGEVDGAENFHGENNGRIDQS